MAGEFDPDDEKESSPKQLSADSTIEGEEKVGPVQRMAFRGQSRSSSLIEVLARVFSSTRLTITAQ